jgi:hypothetical protein
MLAAIERKLAAIVADGLAGRPHLDVVVVRGGATDPPVGRGRLEVGLIGTDAMAAFEVDSFGVVGAGPLPRRRLLPVSFTAKLNFLHTPVAVDAATLADARALQLDDLALTAHLLAASDVRSGQAFAAAADDAGYRVRCFGVGASVLVQDSARTALTASLTCNGEAEIWPPGSATSAESSIRRVERISEVLPVRIEVDRRAVPIGGTTTVRLRAIEGQRLVNPDTGATAPLQLAVSVLSDLPPAQRGSIQSGQPGAETGVRIVPSAGAETVITYQAPGGNVGSVRTEYVVFHLATPDNQRGIFVGSAAISLSSSPL